MDAFVSHPSHVVGPPCQPVDARLQIGDDHPPGYQGPGTFSRHPALQKIEYHLRARIARLAPHCRPVSRKKMSVARGFPFGCEPHVDGSHGFLYASPAGPAIPSPESPRSAPVAIRTPSAISPATSALTDPLATSRSWGTEKESFLGAVAVSDEARFEVVGGARHVGDSRGDKSAGAGFRQGDPHTSPGQ